MTLALVPSRPGYSVVQADAAGRRRVARRQAGAHLAPVSSHAFTGWQLIEDEVLERLPPGKSDTVRDLYRTLAAEGRLNGFLHTGTWVELGTPAQMLEGVLGLLDAAPAVRSAILDPAADPVRARVALGEGTSADGARLAGRVALGEGVALSASASLEDVVALSRARVGEECRLRRVLLAPDTEIPDGTELEDAVAGPAEAGGLWVRSFA